MSSYRRALKRTRVELAAQRAVTPDAYASRHPLRKVRVGDRVQVRAGEVLTIVDDDATVLGHVQAAAGGVFVLEAQAAKLAAARLAAAAAPTVEAAATEELDDTLARVAADRGRGTVPGHPGCERLP